MRKSSKVLALLLVALFAISVFAGCGGSKEPVDGSSAVETTSDAENKENDSTTSDATGSGAVDSDATGSEDKDGPDNTASTSSGKTGVSVGGKKLKINKTGWPIVNDKVEIRVMGIGLPQYGDAKEMSMFKWYEKQTNVKFNFEAIAGGEIAINQKKATVMQSGKFPDMFSFYTNTFSEFEIDKYGKEGAFIDVSKLVEDYAPNIADELDNPIQVALNKSSGGAIYTIPNKPIGDHSLEYEHWLSINKTWLDNLKLKVPTTMTELRNVLRAFRDGDPNRNGQKDELPMAVWIWNDTTVLSGWGINGTGDISVDKKGKVYYARTTENAHQACIYWNQILNEHGLMDKELDGSDGNGQFTKFINKIETGTVGVFNWSYITEWKKELLDQYIPIPYPTANFVNPELDLPKANQPFSSMLNRGCKIITRDCDYPEVVLRYYDYFYTDAGIMLSNYGSPENGYYKQKSDGSYYLTSKAKGVDFCKNHGLSYTMRAHEIVNMDTLLDKSEGTDSPHGIAYERKAAEVYAAALKKDPRPVFIYNRTAEELAKLRKFSSYEGGSGKMSRFVEGFDDLAGWTTWVNSQKANEEACVKLWQSIVDKHKDNIYLLDGDLKF